MRIPFLSKPPVIRTDPVCSMDVDISRPPGGVFEHDHVTYYFCAPGCRHLFVQDPAKYLKT